jgi:uncharacterized SAM-binding protein YcdF (DUF218 family)
MNKPLVSSRTIFLLPPFTVCLLLMLWSIPSLLMAKKVVALLVLPPGLVWLGLMAMAAWPGLHRWGRVLAALLLIGYTVMGNAWFGGWLLGRLEAPYARTAATAERFDAICVLGGGSSASPDGNPQLGPAGDRLIVPVRLFLAGRTAHLVASGLSFTEIGESRSLADETAGLWHDLGIPETSITRLSLPRTTKEEIREYKKLIASRSWQRVGVCSSAWHLRRVELICRNEGVKMVPVPADFLSSPLPWVPMYAVPQARGFQNVQKALWEYLGALTGG